MEFLRFLKNSFELLISIITLESKINFPFFTYIKLSKNSKSILFDSIDASIDFINEYAPEHYIINTSNEEYCISKLSNAGSVFIGNFTPESAGDYASGTNHTLPTNGYAKQYSGVNTDSFLKTISFQKISKSGLMSISNAIETMALSEGLDAHKHAWFPCSFIFNVL